MFKKLFAWGGVAMLLFQGSPALPDSVADCTQESDAPLAVRACTAVIRSGDWAESELAWAFQARGWAQYRSGAYSRAIADYDKALDFEPDRHRIYMARAMAFLRVADNAAARSDIETYLSLGNSWPYAYTILGTALRNLGELEPSLAAFETALARNPDDLDALVGHASTLEHMGQDDRAIAELTVALSRNPDHYEANVTRGMAHRKLGNHAEAIADLSRGLELRPHTALLLKHRAASYARLGNLEAALADWEAEIDALGAERVQAWQEWARDRGGHYLGPIDGIYDHEVRDAILRCAKDPACF